MKENDLNEENNNNNDNNVFEQEEKLNLLKKKNYLLLEELMKKKEEMHKLNEESKNLYDQITYYSNQIQKESNNDIKNKSTIIDNNSSFNSMNPLISNSNLTDNLSKIENEDEFLVYEVLKNKLDEVNLNMDIVENFPESKNIYENYNSNLSYNCICVCLLEIIENLNENKNNFIVDKTFNMKNNKNNNKNKENDKIKKIYYQTFRINKKTRINDVLKECLIFWDKFNKENDYNIGLILENSIKKININENELLINIFKNLKNNLKSMKFLLYPKNEKISFDEIFEEENNNNNANPNNNNNKIDSNNNNNFIKFLKCIAGTRNYVEETYNKIKEENNKEKEILSNENKINLKFIITKSLFLILFFLFFLFSILNLCDMKNSQKTFELRETILNGINYFYKNIYFNSDKELINEILNSFKYILFHIEEDSPTFKLVNNVRFSFYENNKIECNKKLKDYYFNFFGNKLLECSENFYNNKKTNEIKNFNIDYILNHKDKFCDENNETSEFFVKNFFVYEICDLKNNKSEILEKCNYIKNCSNFYDYLSEIIDHHSYNNDNNNINIDGDYGIYKGENTYDINIPLNYINYNTLNAILNSLIKEDVNSENYFSFFNQKITKSILIDFTLYDYNSNTYFYVYILYELGENFGKKLTKKDAIPFHPNLKKIYYGKRIKILDIFRLIIIIFLFLIFINNFVDNFSDKNKSKNFKKKKIIHNESKFYNIFSLHNFLDLLSFIFYLIIFIKKKHFLYQNQEKNENLTTIKNFIIPENFEYFTIANQYEIVIILESLLILILIIRIICFFKLKRIKFFQFYLKKSLIRIFPYFFIYIFLLIAFSIFANKLFGLHNNNFSDFKKSFFKIVQFSILHFSFDDFKFNGSFINYEALFMLLFYMIIIFYITSNFLGILIEAYRLNSLQYGNIHSNRMTKKINKNEKNEDKNEKNSIN